MDTKGCFINGRWLDTKDRLPVRSPWSGEVVGEVSLAGAAEWEAAIIAAQEAAVLFRSFSSRERRSLLEIIGRRSNRPVCTLAFRLGNLPMFPSRCYVRQRTYAETLLH